MKYNIETELGAVAQLIERGEMVALRGINTYLVCSALNEESISKALKIKGKHDNPLILYTASLNMANEYIRNISHEAYVTAKKVMAEFSHIYSSGKENHSKRQYI